MNKITPKLMVALLTGVSIFSTPKASAQIDAGAALLTAAAGAGGLAIGNAFTNQWGPASYVGAAALPLLANWGYGVFKSKSDEDKIKYYLSGRNYERWMQSQQIWYQSTLDPYTGRPQAFSGLNAMDDGIPASGTQDASSTRSIAHVYTSPVKLPSGTYEGVPYTERVVEFPRLP